MAELATSASVKAVLGIPSAVTQYDTLIATLIEVADQEVLGYCNLTTLSQQTITETFDVQNISTDHVMLKNFPIQSVTSVSNADTTLETSDYDVDLRLGKVTLSTMGSYFTEGRQKVQVVYVAGYTSPPNDLKHAATLIACHHFNSNRLAGISSQQAGAVKISKSEGGLPSDVLRILGRYSRIMT